MYSAKRQPLLTTLNILILIALIAFIFSRSLQNADISSEESSRILLLFTNFLKQFLGSANLTEHMVRKLAHFCEFSALGFFTLHLCVVRHRVQPHFVLHSLSFGLLCAVTDESLQLFSPGRSAQLSDVWLDFSGVVFGSCVLLLLCAICRAWNRRRSG